MGRSGMHEALSEPEFYEGLAQSEGLLPRPSRTGNREAIDALDRRRRPYDLILTFKGGAEQPWGRWADPEMAHAAGTVMIEERRKNYLPVGKRVYGYLVVHYRTGLHVEPDDIIVPEQEQIDATREWAKLVSDYYRDYGLLP